MEGNRLPYHHNSTECAMQRHFTMPGDALALDPVEFQFTLLYALEMARSPSLLCNPSECVFKYRGADNKVHQARLINDPENRFGMAVVARYRNDLKAAWSFMSRWYALCDLVRSRVLDGRYFRRAEKGGEGDWLDDAAVILAASFPLDRRGEFGPQAFLSALRKVE